MNTGAPAPPTAEGTVVPPSKPLAERAPVPENWKPLFRELTAYFRQLPQLLSDGETGRYAVVQGDQLVNTWDSYRDALQYGNERFGDQLYLIHQVDARDIERLARFVPAPEAPCPG